MPVVLVLELASINIDSTLIKTIFPIYMINGESTLINVEFSAKTTGICQVNNFE